MPDTITPSDRILRERHVTCIATNDTIHNISQRVRNLLAANRRIAITDRYTHTDGPPDVAAGLTVDEIRDGKKGGIGVHLKPGIRYGFGIHANTDETESQAWDRYRRDNRANLTRVDITGGLPGDSPAPDDRLVIRRWISDRVCREIVVAFDYNYDARDRLARHLYLDAVGDGTTEVEAWDTGRVGDGIYRKYLDKAAAIIAVINQPEQR